MTEKTHQYSKTHQTILIILGIIFFFIYSYLTLGTTDGRTIFNSPDETANHFFISHFADTGSLSYAEPLNEQLDNLIHPRSTNVYQGNIVPGSFLGMILIYGTIAGLFGKMLIPFLTPFVAVVAAFYFYRLITIIYNQKIAFISSLLLFILPPFWYFSTRGMFSQVLFVSLLIIASYYLMKLNWMKGEKLLVKDYLKSILVGVVFGLTINVRPVELIMLFIIALFLFIYNYKKIKLVNVLLIAIGIVIATLPILYFNQITYGNVLTTGYANLESSSMNVLAPDIASQDAGRLGRLSSLVFPFGINLENIIRNAWNYIMEMHWWLGLFLVLGFIISLKRFTKLVKLQKAYLIVFTFIGIWLTFFYGSWKVTDRLATGEATIGTSYNRYWLLVFIMALPLVSLGIRHMVKISPKRIKGIVVMIIAITFFYASYNLTYFQTSDSLYEVNNSIVEYQQQYRQVEKNTTKESIIITQKTDKIFFPDRKVISIKKDGAPVIRKMSKIANGAPVYFYTLINPEDMENINQGLFRDNEAELVLVDTVEDHNYLYRLILNQ